MAIQVLAVIGWPVFLVWAWWHDRRLKRAVRY